MASKLVTSFFQHALKAGTFILQTPLQRTGTYVQRIGDVFNGRTLARELLLYGYADAFEEILVTILLLQFFFELWRKHSQKFGIAGNERALGVG